MWIDNPRLDLLTRVGGHRDHPTGSQGDVPGGVDRSEIERREPAEIADLLTQAFDQFCVTRKSA